MWRTTGIVHVAQENDQHSAITCGRGHNLVPSCLCECRESGREHEREDEDDADGVRACSNDSFDGESVEEPDWNHE